MRTFSTQRYTLWTLGYLSSLFVALGFTPALRGAGMGLGSWIERADQVSAILTQLTALAASIFLVELIVTSVQKAGERPVSLLLAAFSTVQGIVLLFAVQGTVQGSLAQLNVLSLLGSGLLVTLTRLWQRPRSAIFPGLICLALSTRFYLSLGEDAPRLGPQLALFASLSALGALALALYEAFPRASSAVSTVHVAAITSAPDTLSRVMLGPLDPVILQASESLPGLDFGLGCLVPLAFPLAVDAYRRGKSPAYALLLAASVAPLSPLVLVASSIGFLLMGLERAPQKIR